VVFFVSLPMVSRAVRPAAAGWLATWLALVLFGSVVVVVVGVVAHTHARRGEEGVASAHPVAVVFVASFFCGCDGGNGGIGMYVESLRCLLLLLLLLLLHRLLLVCAIFFPKSVLDPTEDGC